MTFVRGRRQLFEEFESTEIKTDHEAPPRDGRLGAAKLMLTLDVTVDGSVVVSATLSEECRIPCIIRDGCW